LGKEESNSHIVARDIGTTDVITVTLGGQYSRRALILKKKKIVFVFILAALFVFTTSQFLLAGERTVKLAVPGCV
jgi:hypothetical protein